MADRDDAEREVLTSLPRSRPVRRSSKRGDRAKPASAAQATAQNATATVEPARKPVAAARSGKAAATKPRSTRPRPASAQDAAPQTDPRPRVAPQRKVPPAGYAAPAGRAETSHDQGPTELITTVLQAANELAQIGLTVGRQTLQSMLERLPKP